MKTHRFCAGEEKPLQKNPMTTAHSSDFYQKLLETIGQQHRQQLMEQQLLHSQQLLALQRDIGEQAVRVSVGIFPNPPGPHAVV